jgi:hypothetical protein
MAVTCQVVAIALQKHGGKMSCFAQQIATNKSNGRIMGRCVRFVNSDIEMSKDDKID